MKFTIVVDTEDEEGILDTYKIVNHFFMKLPASLTGVQKGRHVKYTKIPLVKMLRKHAKEVIEAAEHGEDGQGLRFNKVFADQLFAEQPENKTIK